MQERVLTVFVSGLNIYRGPVRDGKRESKRDVPEPTKDSVGTDYGSRDKS